MSPSQQFVHGTTNSAILRQRAYELCNIADRVPNHKRPNTILLTRPTEKRSIINSNNLIEILSSEIRGITVAMTMPSDFCQQVNFMASADFVIAIHGSELTNLVWMRPHSVVIEISPLLFFHPCWKPLAAYSQSMISFLFNIFCS